MLILLFSFPSLAVVLTLYDVLLIELSHSQSELRNSFLNIIKVVISIAHYCNNTRYKWNFSIA